MTTLDIITIVLFSLGVVLVGLAFSQKGKSMQSFFAANGTMPWYMSGLSLFMGFFSAGTFVVWGSIAYSMGWVSITIQWTMAIAGFIVGLLIAPKWHKTGALTAAEYIHKRLGKSTQKIYTYLFLFISVFLTASFLYPVAKILEVSTGLPLSFDKINGVTALIEQVPDTFYNLLNDEYTFGFLVAFGIYNTIFLGGNWAYVQRYTCVKTQKDSQKVGYLFGALYIISPVLWMLPPMVYRVYDPSLSLLDAEGAYLMMCKEVLPNGLLGLMIGGMIFATTSALNSKLNIASGVITNDIFKNLRPKSSDRTLMYVARISTILFGVFSILIAMLIPKMGGVVNVVISLAALTGVPLYLPIIWTLFSKRQTATSNITTTLLSLAINGLFKFITPLMGFSLNRAEEMILGVTFPILCLAIFEIYYKAKNKESEKYQSYLIWNKENNARKLKEIEENESTEKAGNNFSKRVIGYGIFASGAGIAILGGMADNGQKLIITTGVVFALLGLLMTRKSKPTISKD